MEESKFTRFVDIIKFMYWPLVLLLVFFSVHPYEGLWHDAFLYAAQALQRINPSAFSSDVFFIFGSQDQFTIFTYLYAQVIRLLGLNGAAIALTLFSQLLWIFGAWKLAQSFLDGTLRWLALFLVVCLPSYYALEVFAYGESFLSARLPAEALVLWSLGWYLQRSKKMAYAIALVAVLIHPLIGIWGGTLILVMDWGWRKSFFGVLLACLLLIVAMPERVFGLMDYEWFDLVSTNSRSLISSEWRLGYWSRAGFCLAAAIWLAWVEDREPLKKFWINLSLLAIFGLFLSVANCAVVRNQLVMQAQTLRVLWLIYCVNGIACVALFVKYREGKLGGAWLFLFLSCWFARESIGGWFALVLVGIIWPLREKLINERLVQFKGLFVVLFFAVCFVSWIPIALIELSLANVAVRTNNSAIWLVNFAKTTPFVLVVIILWKVASEKSNKFLDLACFVMVGAVLVFLAVNWDHRTSKQRYAEVSSGNRTLRPFGEKIQEGKMVYWPESPEMVWFDLRTASYISSIQISGIVFNRQTAIEAWRRSWRIALAGLNLEEIGSTVDQKTIEVISKGKVNFGTSIRKISGVELTNSGLKYLCQDKLLDYVVLNYRYAELSIDEYVLPSQNIHYWLYDCAAIRAKFPVADIKVFSEGGKQLLP